MTQTLRELCEQVQGCTKCRLCEGRTRLVFGVGPPNARVMLVGEGPGQHEDEQGEPFVGRAGILLDKMLDSVGLSRQKNVYITNMVKCRPPQNRDPQPDETDACLPWLRAQTRLLRPRVIVCLGRVSAKRLIDPAFKVTQQHGVFFERGDTLLMGTLHPAALLRNPRQKPDAMADWLQLRDLLLQECPEVYADNTQEGLL